MGKDPPKGGSRSVHRESKPPPSPGWGWKIPAKLAQKSSFLALRRKMKGNNEMDKKKEEKKKEKKKRKKEKKTKKQKKEKRGKTGKENGRKKTKKKEK